MKDMSFVQLFDYVLPEELIADEPLARRDSSRFLIVDRKGGSLEHTQFFDLVDMLDERDVLVLNKSKVFPARMFGKKVTGGKVEILLTHQVALDTWRIISRPGLKVGLEILFGSGVKGAVVKRDEVSGEAEMQFSFPQKTFFEALDSIGNTPIPPYIHSKLSEEDLRRRYQTVFAKEMGSVAAPTAGLHFTDELLQKLEKKGVYIEYVTLHVGLGTFQSLRPEHFNTKSLHGELYEVSEGVAKRLNEAKHQGKRIIAVGTTTTRTLESIVNETGVLVAGSGETKLFIYPPYKFRFVDSIITNFHLPKSSLLMLISAFASHPNTSIVFTNFSESLLGKAYMEAVMHMYRFFSFGDVMWIR